MFVIRIGLEIQNPNAKCGTQAQSITFPVSFIGDIVLNAEVKVSWLLQKPVSDVPKGPQRRICT